MGACDGAVTVEKRGEGDRGPEGEVKRLDKFIQSWQDKCFQMLASNHREWAMEPRDRSRTFEAPI